MPTMPTPDLPISINIGSRDPHLHKTLTKAQDIVFLYYDCVQQVIVVVVFRYFPYCCTVYLCYQRASRRSKLKRNYLQPRSSEVKSLHSTFYRVVEQRLSCMQVN